MNLAYKVRLNRMPFDKFEDNTGFTPATGYECFFDDGSHYVEYEDDPTVGLEVPIIDEDDYYANDEFDEELSNKKKKYVIPDMTAAVDSINASVGDCAASTGVCESLLKPVNMDNLKMSIVTDTIDFLIAQGYSEDDANVYTDFDIYEEEDRFVVSVRTDLLDFDGMSELAIKLGPDVQIYDDDAYFDNDDAGIITAYIYKNNGIFESLKRIDRHVFELHGRFSNLIEQYEDIQHKLSSKQKTELKAFTEKASSAEDVTQFISDLVNPDNKITEDIDIPVEQPTAEDESAGIINLLNTMIQKEYDVVSDLSSIIITLKDMDYESITTVIQNILDDTNNHIGQLQQLIDILNPGLLDDIANGQEEAEAIVNTTVAESLKNTTNKARVLKLLHSEKVDESLVEEVSDKKYYVSYYEETPSDDPNTAPTCTLYDSVEFDNLDDARKYLAKEIENDSTMVQKTTDFYIDQSKYTGQDRFYIIETEQGSEERL